MPGGFRISVEILGVVLTRERQQLLFSNHARTRIAFLALDEVFVETHTQPLPNKPLLHRQGVVDQNLGAIDKAGLVGRQIHNEVGDVLRLAEAPRSRFVILSL